MKAEATPKKMRPLGKLIGLSLGPGDPGLITRKAWEYLHTDALWCYPIKKRGSQSYALAIVERAGLQAPEDATALVFPMTSDREKLAQAWATAASELLICLQSGRDALFLVEGDASTYSTFAHLARNLTLLEPAMEVETLPGVTSFNAAAATLQEPLALEGDTFAVIPAGYGVEMIRRLLPEFDCLVLLKVKPLLDELIELIEEEGLTGEARFIEKVGTAEQRIENDLTKLKGEKVNYLSLLILHHPNRQRGPLTKGCKKNFL